MPMVMDFTTAGAELSPIRGLLSREAGVVEHARRAAPPSMASHRELLTAGKEILMNELGVVFRKEGPGRGAFAEGDAAGPDHVGTEGTVDGSRYRHSAAHFEWLVHMAEPLGIQFDQMGKRRHGTASTLFF